MLNVMTKTAREEILSAYDQETLRDIATYGCSSGLAREHVYYSETGDFFKKHEDEIEDYLANYLGEEWIQLICKDPWTVSGVQTLINQIVWAYIEAVAQEATNDV